MSTMNEGGTSPAPVIAATNLHKTYGDVEAVKDLSFTVDAGQIVGLLGPNGAGKTTTINMLATLVPIDGGSVSIGGFDVAAQAYQVRQLIGLAGQSAAVDEKLTARENLELFGRLYKIPRSQRRRRTDELIELFDMADFADRVAGSYSGGQRRRLDVVAALVADPISAATYLDDYGRLKEAINRYCWSDEDSFYFDLAEHTQIRRFHVGAFWALIAGVCPEEKAEAFAAHLIDPARFGRTVPVPSLSADDPDYAPGGSYWVGSSWAPTTYMVLKGLKASGLDELAAQLGQKYSNVICKVVEETGTLWENYAPDEAKPGSTSQPDFVGWTGLASVAVPREIL